MRASKRLREKRRSLRLALAAACSWSFNSASPFQIFSDILRNLTFDCASKQVYPQRHQRACTNEGSKDSGDLAIGSSGHLKSKAFELRWPGRPMIGSQLWAGA